MASTKGIQKVLRGSINGFVSSRRRKLKALTVLSKLKKVGNKISDTTEKE